MLIYQALDLARNRQTPTMDAMLGPLRAARQCAPDFVTAAGLPVEFKSAPLGWARGAVRGERSRQPRRPARRTTLRAFGSRRVRCSITPGKDPGRPRPTEPPSRRRASFGYCSAPGATP